MIFGAHVIVFTHDAEADRNFFRDVLGMESVDSGGGWLIFAMPPSEIAFHPTDESPTNEIYLLCDDLGSEMRQLEAKGVAFSRWTKNVGERSRDSRCPAARRSVSISPSTRWPSSANDCTALIRVGRAVGDYALVVTLRLKSAADTRPAKAKKAITSSTP